MNREMILRVADAIEAAAKPEAKPPMGFNMGAVRDDRSAFHSDQTVHRRAWGGGMSAHTPGPWRTTKSNPRAICNEGGDKWIAKALVGTAKLKSPRFLKDDDQAEANARLMASAPDLLAALKLMAAEASLADVLGYGWDEARAAARAAISKAEARP